MGFVGVSGISVASSEAVKFILSGPRSTLSSDVDPQFLSDLHYRCIHLQSRLWPCLPGGRQTPVVALSPVLPLTLVILTGLPGWTLELGHHLILCGTVLTLVTSTRFCLPGSDTAGLCPGEGTALCWGHLWLLACLALGNSLSLLFLGTCKLCFSSGILHFKHKKYSSRKVSKMSSLQG